MTRWGSLVIVAVVGAGYALTGHAQTAPQAVFRTNTDLITVPVFVKGRDPKLGDLRASDFVIIDNGVPQTVETVDGESLPVDVTVLIETGKAIEDYRKSINEQVTRIASMMRPTDRIEVLGIDDYVHVLVPFGPPSRSLTVSTFAGGGMMSINDALVASLLRESDPDRRHLVIAVTDTVDTMSTLTMAHVRDVARQSSATLVIAWITMSQDGPPSPGVPWATVSERVARHVRAPRTLGEAPMLNIPGALATPRSSAVIVGRTVPPRQQWTPHYLPPVGRPWEAFDTLREAATFTGGDLHPPGLFTDRNASAIFDKVYAEFRQNYILRYLPTGVSRVGWHDVQVTIPKTPNAEIRARRGYLVEAMIPKVAPIEAAPIEAAPPTSLAALTVAAGALNLDGMRLAIASADTPERLGTLMADFQAAGDLIPSDPRREFVAALTLANAGLMSPAEAVRGEAVKMLIRYRGLVRPPLGPDEFARLWAGAATTMLDAAARPGGLDDPRLIDGNLAELLALIR